MSYYEPSLILSRRFVRAVATLVLVLVHVLAVDRLPVVLSAAALVFVQVMVSARATT